MMKSVERDSFFDIVKGICILFVIITHFSWQEEERLRYLFPFWINMAVPAFMIVSGYVYAKSLERKNINSFSGAYQSKFIAGKIVRYTIPFLVAFLLEIVLDFVAAYITGGGYSDKLYKRFS